MQTTIQNPVVQELISWTEWSDEEYLVMAIWQIIYLLMVRYSDENNEEGPSFPFIFYLKLSI